MSGPGQIEKTRPLFTQERTLLARPKQYVDRMFIADVDQRQVSLMSWNVQSSCQYRTLSLLDDKFAMRVPEPFFYSSAISSRKTVLNRRLRLPTSAVASNSAPSSVYVPANPMLATCPANGRTSKVGVCS